MRNVQLLFAYIVLFTSYAVNGQKTVDYNGCSEIWASSLSQKEYNIYILGEDHGENNIDHQMGLIAHLNSTQKICKLGLELPLAYEPFYNAYLQSSDDRILNLMRYININQIRKSEYCFIEQLRLYNANQGKDNPIRVFCYDVSHSGGSATLLSLQYLFSGLPNTDQLALHQYLSIDAKKFKDYEGRYMVKVLSEDLDKKDSLYKSFLKDNYELYIEIIEGMEIAFSRDFLMTKDSWLSREDYLFRNIQAELVGDTSRVLIFCGQAHASKLEMDSTYLENGFSSFTSQLHRTYPDEVFSIGTFYIKGKRYNNRTLDNHLFSFQVWGNPKHDVILLNHDSLANHPKINDRFDMALIKVN